MTRIKQSFFLATTILLLPAMGCTTSPTQAQPGLKAVYEFPIIPIEISYDLSNGSVSVSISKKIRTPLGSFGISGELNISKEKPNPPIKSPTGRRLIVDAGNQRTIYEIDPSCRYKVKVETGAGIMTMDFSEDGDIYVKVPPKEKPSPTPEPASYNEIQNELESAWREKRATKYCSCTPCKCHQTDVCECVPSAPKQYSHP